MRLYEVEIAPINIDGEITDGAEPMSWKGFARSQKNAEFKAMKELNVNNPDRYIVGTREFPLT